MPRRDPPGLVAVLLLVLAILGGLIGIGLARTALPQFAGNPRPTKPCVLPHHVPKYPGVASLRFAMVHDVVTERYPKHGPAYYEERNRLTRLDLEKEKEPTKKHFELIDDLAAGLDHLRRHDESIRLMRDKLKRQLDLGQSGMDLYSTYANLGTFIILWEIHEGFADKDKAKAGLKEGLDYIHKAIDINPRSHFGREVWQAVILEYLIAFLDDPELVVRFDMTGNAFGDTLAFPANPRVSSFRTPVGFSRRKGWADVCEEASAYLRRPESEQSAEASKRFRDYIMPAIPAPDWAAAVKSRHQEAVPFDEPTLGIIGMWRIGGGPNPFFAVALGEIMLRVGQGYNAWNAYERAYLLADGLPESVRGKFKDHCRTRQKTIEDGLPADDVSKLRPSFEMHLEKGLAYQKAYQEYEARRIEEGADIRSHDFYEPFDKEHGSIASPVGDEDRFLPGDEPPTRFAIPWPAAILGAGIFAFLGALLIRVRDSRANRNADDRI